MSSSKRPTVADLIALKGQRQITMLYVDTADEAAAAAAAGIDLVGIEDRELETFLHALEAER